MNFLALRRHLQTEPLRPAYCVYGEDCYLCARALADITGLVTFCPELNVNYLPANASARDIVEAAEMLPMGGLRAVVVRGWEGKEFDVLNAYIASPSPSSVLVMSWAGGAAPAKLKGAEPVDCSKLDAGTLTRWINARLKIEPAAAALLVRRCGADMTRISVETEKLRGFTAEGEVLTARDIEEMVAPDTDFRVYELSDAAARGDRAAAFRIANAFIADKLPPVTLMSGLYSHFRRLLYAAITAGSSDEIARLLNVKPYAARAAAGQARRFTPRRLKRIADTFHDYETAVKSGKMNDYGAFILTIARIAESAVTA